MSLGVGGIMVSIAAFQAVDPGSIPGRRIFFQLRPVPHGITDLNFRRGKTIPFFWTIAKRDAVAEWFRRWTANPMGSARGGSTPLMTDPTLTDPPDGVQPPSAVRRRVWESKRPQKGKLF